MAIHKIEVEIEIEDGFEFVRLDGDGARNENEFKQGVVKLNGIIYYVIVRKAWQWPEWLKAEWIARDADAEWWAFYKRPNAVCGSWVSDCDRYCLLTEGLVAFTPPLCTDWTQSLRRNPKAEVVK